MSVALTSPRPSVTIGDARGSVSIGTGRRSITLTSPAVVSITGVSSRVEIAAAPRVEIVGAKQGIAGPPGPGAAPLATVPRGEAISGARCVYLADVDGEIKAFRASALDAAKWAQGFVVEAGAAGAVVDVWDERDIPGLSGIAIRGQYFLGANGEFATSIPVGAAIAQLVGIGSTSAIIKGRVHPPTFVRSA